MQNEVALSYHRVRGQYFLAVIFVAAIFVLKYARGVQPPKAKKNRNLIIVLGQKCKFMHQNFCSKVNLLYSFDFLVKNVLVLNVGNCIFNLVPNCN